MAVKKRIISIVSQDGILELVRRSLLFTRNNSLYRVRNLLRSISPTVKTRVLYNVPVVEECPITDRIFSNGMDQYDPKYKSPNIASLYKSVNSGDSVTIIGGGRGVTAVIAARIVGPSGEVVVYEAVEDRVTLIKQTIRLNNVQDRVNVKSLVVGEISEELPFSPDTGQIDPSDLEPCSVLEIDAEGAETDILSNLDISPRDIIVETHGFLGSPMEDSIEALESLEYEVVNKEPVDNGQRYAKKNDAYVLTAEYSP